MRLRFCMTSLALLLVAVSAQANDQRARTNYMLHCSGCHQVDGSGSPGNGIPAMNGRLGHFLKLPEGRAFLVQVPGTSQSSLNNALTAEMLNWLLRAISAEQMTKDFSAFTTDEVASLRARPLDDAAATRTRIAARLNAMGFNVD